MEEDNLSPPGDFEEPPPQLDQEAEKQTEGKAGVNPKAGVKANSSSTPLFDHDSGLDDENDEEEVEEQQIVPTAPPNSPTLNILDNGPITEPLKTPNTTKADQKADGEWFVGCRYKPGERLSETIEDIKAFVEKPVTRSTTSEKSKKVARKLDLGAKNGKTVGNVADDGKKKTVMRDRPKKRVTLSKKSGLVFPVSRVVRHLRRGKFAKHVGVAAGVYLAATLEYLVAEVLELAGNCAKYYKKRRIFPRCVLLTFRHDSELDALTRNAVVPQGGVKPFIHRELLPAERQVSHYHPRFGGFLNTQDMVKYNLKPAASSSKSGQVTAVK